MINKSSQKWNGSQMTSRSTLCVECNIVTLCIIKQYQTIKKGGS